MTKSMKMFNGEIREFSNNEEWHKLQDENWNMWKIEDNRKKEEVKSIIVKIKEYVNKWNESSIHEIGLVHTKLEEDIVNRNSFLIWIDKGNTISHKGVNISDMETIQTI